MLLRRPLPTPLLHLRRRALPSRASQRPSQPGLPPPETAHQRPSLPLPAPGWRAPGAPPFLRRRALAPPLRFELVRRRRGGRAAATTLKQSRPTRDVHDGGPLEEARRTRDPGELDHRDPHRAQGWSHVRPRHLRRPLLRCSARPGSGGRRLRRGGSSLHDFGTRASRGGLGPAPAEHVRWQEKQGRRLSSRSEQGRR